MCRPRADELDHLLPGRAAKNKGRYGSGRALGREAGISGSLTSSLMASRMTERERETPRGTRAEILSRASPRAVATLVPSDAQAEAIQSSEALFESATNRALAWEALGTKVVVVFTEPASFRW